MARPPVVDESGSKAGYPYPNASAGGTREKMHNTEMQPRTAQIEAQETGVPKRRAATPTPIKSFFLRHCNEPLHHLRRRAYALPLSPKGGRACVDVWYLVLGLQGLSAAEPPIRIPVHSKRDGARLGSRRQRPRCQRRDCTVAGGNALGSSLCHGCKSLLARAPEAGAATRARTAARLGRRRQCGSWSVAQLAELFDSLGLDFFVGVRKGTSSAKTPGSLV